MTLPVAGGRAAPNGVPEAKADRAQGLGHRLRKSQAQSLPRHTSRNVANGWIADVGVSSYPRTMSDGFSADETVRLREELGPQQFEAIQHWLSDGDYLGLNCGDYRGAIEEYEKAWQLLATPWQRQTGGADILRASLSLLFSQRTRN